MYQRIAANRSHSSNSHLPQHALLPYYHSRKHLETLLDWPLTLRYSEAMSDRPTDLSPPPFARRLFHLAATSAVPLVAFVLPEPLYTHALGIVVLAAVALETLRLRHPASNRLFLRVFSPVLKRSEKSKVTGATHFAVAAYFCFLLFGHAAAIPALLFHVVGDPAAALIDRRAPGPRLQGRSPIRMAAYVATGMVVWAVICSLHLGEWSLAVFAALVAAALVELLPSPVDDNLAAPLIGGLALYLLASYPL